jgi:hypothetical protein
MPWHPIKRFVGRSLIVGIGGKLELPSEKKRKTTQAVKTTPHIK